MPDHLRAADAAERAQRGHEINRFEDVRLALRVVAEQQMEARRKIRVQPRVIAEVPESQMGQMHAEKIGARTACPRVLIALESKLQLVFGNRLMNSNNTIHAGNCRSKSL